MTKLQLQFDLQEPLNEQLEDKIARLHGVYGIYGVRVGPGLNQITVEYDASRYSAFDLEGVLLRAGLPICKHV